MVAPDQAARWAERIWFTLPRPRRSTALPAGGTSFEVLSGGTVIRGASYGDGPVVYLVHGWGGRGAQLGAFVGPLVNRGFRVVTFDGPSHGDSDPGRFGARSSTGTEMGQALDAVAARFGPAHAVVAHSMGAVATTLALRDGWLGTERLALVAPMVRVAPYLDAFQRMLGFGRRTRRRLEDRTSRRVGIPVDEFDLEAIGADVMPANVLVVHDRQDKETSYADSVGLTRTFPQAVLHTTDGLGHRRILDDDEVVRIVADFVGAPALQSQAVRR